MIDLLCDEFPSMFEFRARKLEEIGRNFAGISTKEKKIEFFLDRT